MTCARFRQCWDPGVARAAAFCKSCIGLATTLRALSSTPCRATFREARLTEAGEGRQTREISAVLSRCDPEEDDVDVSLLKYVSPVEWDNVVLYGQYILDRKLIR